MTELAEHEWQPLLQCVDCGYQDLGVGIRVSVHDQQTEPRCDRCAAAAERYFREQAADPDEAKR
jgi:hypothetical protein